MGDLAQQLKDYSDRITAREATVQEWQMVQHAAAALARATDEEALARVASSVLFRDTEVDEAVCREAGALIARAIIQHIAGGGQ